MASIAAKVEPDDGKYSLTCSEENAVPGTSKVASMCLPGMIRRRAYTRSLALHL
jgi:hypothetical protein